MDEQIAEITRKKYPPPISCITIFVGFTGYQPNEVPEVQDILASALTRAGMRATPNRFNTTDGCSVVEFFVPENIDQEFAQEIVENELEYHFKYIVFNPNQS